MGETFCVLCIHCVYNTRLESVFIENYSIILEKRQGKFPDGKFPEFPEILPGKFSRREASRIPLNFTGGQFF